MIGYLAVGIDVKFLLVTIFVSRLEMNEIVLARLINTHTYQYAATFKNTEVLL